MISRVHDHIDIKSEINAHETKTLKMRHLGKDDAFVILPQMTIQTTFTLYGKINLEEQNINSGCDKHIN